MTSTLISQPIIKKAISNDTINHMTQCRYKYYEKALREEDIVWDNELNSWLIFKYDLIQDLLKDKRFKANRKGDFVKKLATSETNKNILSSFYSNWLMYMDAPNHGELRRKVQVPLNKVTKDVSIVAKEVATQLIHNTLTNKKEFDADSEIATPFVVKILSNVLGLGEKDYREILIEATNAVSFLWKPLPSQTEIEDAVTSIKKTYEIVNDIIENNLYEEDKLLDLMIKEVGHRDEVLALIVNIMVDGHEPFLSSVKATINCYLEYLEIDMNLLVTLSKNKLVNEVLRLESPFPYCARSAIENIDVGGQTILKGQRVMFFISAGNRDMNHFNSTVNFNNKEKTPKMLTFGVGSHYCIGGILTVKSIEEFIEVFSKFAIENKLQIKNCTWKESFGYRTITDLILSINKI